VVECNHGLGLDSDCMSLMLSNTKDGRNSNFAMNYSFQQCVSADVRHFTEPNKLQIITLERMNLDF
jgi:hypothetical protein